jgi:hypothetical protein
MSGSRLAIRRDLFSACLCSQVELTLTYQQLILAVGKRQEVRGEAADPSFRRYGNACYFVVLAVGFVVIAA